MTLLVIAFLSGTDWSTTKFLEKLFRRDDHRARYHHYISKSLENSLDKIRIFK